MNTLNDAITFARELVKDGVDGVQAAIYASMAFKLTSQETRMVLNEVFAGPIQD